MAVKKRAKKKAVKKGARRKLAARRTPAKKAAKRKAAARKRPAKKAARKKVARKITVKRKHHAAKKPKARVIRVTITDGTPSLDPVELRRGKDHVRFSSTDQTYTITFEDEWPFKFAADDGDKSFTLQAG